MNEQDFQARVISYLAGELSAEEALQVREQSKVSVERQKFFEECREVWEQTAPTDELPEIPDLDLKWERFEKAVFVKGTPVINLKQTIRPWLRVAAVFLLLATGIAAWFIISRPLPTKTDYVITESQDRHTEVSLPDGSMVYLAKGSQISYEKTFEIRSIQLKGKALFEVMHLIDNRPFVVQTGATKTTVLGTVFMVDAQEAGTKVSVYVKEGRVSFEQIDQRDNSLILTGGEEGEYNSSTKVIKMQEVVGSNKLSWKTGEFRFADAPLSEILMLLEDYYNVAFEVKNQQLLDCTYNTNFSGVDLKDIISELTFGLNLRFEQKGPGEYIVDGTQCK